jgi:hypothetical protein
MRDDVTLFLAFLSGSVGLVDGSYQTTTSQIRSGARIAQCARRVRYGLTRNRCIGDAVHSSVQETLNALLKDI